MGPHVPLTIAMSHISSGPFAYQKVSCSPNSLYKSIESRTLMMYVNHRFECDSINSVIDVQAYTPTTVPLWAIRKVRMELYDVSDGNIIDFTHASVCKCIP